MAQTIKQRRAATREQVKKHRQNEKDRQLLLRDLFEDAPAGFGKRFTFRIDYVDGEPIVTLKLPEQRDADHVNRFAAKIRIKPDAVLRVIAEYAGRRFMRGDFQQEDSNDGS